MICTRPALLFIGCTLLMGGCSDQSPQDPQAPMQAAPPVATPPVETPPAESGRRGGPAKAVPQTAQPIAGTATPDMEWDALIPDDYRPDRLMEEFQVEDMSDEDPRAAEFMARLKELWDQAPVREDLDGVEIRLPGFVVPVEADEKETTGFLLVPYYGACVHVPPPPANQTVYVITEAGAGTRPELFDVIWVTGTMSVKRIENDVAEAGYTLYANRIEPYE